MGTNQNGKIGKHKGLDEMTDWSQDVRDCNGIHCVTASPPHAGDNAGGTDCGCARTRSTTLAPWQLETVRNRYLVVEVTNERLHVQQERLRDKGFTPAPPDEDWIDHVFPTRPEQC